MKILTYSDLHLEFSQDITLPQSCDADIVILAGDILTFKDFRPLTHFLKGWTKPVLYVAGNHEYYTRSPMEEKNKQFKLWLTQNHPQVISLQNEAFSLDNVHFFGGTMWTDFDNSNPLAMTEALQCMNDYRYIYTSPQKPLRPEDTITLHKTFTAALTTWFKKKLTGPRIVITHHAPVKHLKTKYQDSALQSAFCSLDMINIIEHYQPPVWIYGHTHECDDQRLGQTHIISNQRGYPTTQGKFECDGFDPEGKPIIIS